MFHKSPDERLSAWKSLREQINESDTPLEAVAEFWGDVPLISYNHLIDQYNPKSWPTPWHLLNNNGYCELARALGIVYTIMIIENRTYTDLKIVQTKEDNLVLVDDGKYILNWAPGEMLNTHSTPIPTVKNAIDSSELESFLQ